MAPPSYGYAAPYGYAPLPSAGPTTRGQVVAIIASWLLFWPACFIIIWRTWPRSRKWGWTAASVGYFVVALIVVGGIAAAVSGSDHSAAMEHSILADGARQLSANAKIYDPNGTPTVTINDVHCIQSAGTQNYSCQGTTRSTTHRKASTSSTSSRSAGPATPPRTASGIPTGPAHRPDERHGGARLHSSRIAGGYATSTVSA